MLTMSKYTRVLLIAAMAAVCKGVSSETSKLEEAARSRNWDEFNKLLSQKFEQSTFPMPIMPIMPLLPPITPTPNTFPPFPKLILFKESEDKSQMDAVKKFSGLVIRSSNATIIDEKGNVIEKGGTSVYSNSNAEINLGDDPSVIAKYPTVEMRSMAPMPPLPPMPTMPPMPIMVPMPNITFPPFPPFPPFPKMTSFKEFEDTFGKNPAFNDTTEASNRTTSIQATCYVLYFSLVITVWNYLYKY